MFIARETWKSDSTKSGYDDKVLGKGLERADAVRIVTDAASAHATDTGHAIDKVWDFPGKHSIHCACRRAFVATGR